LSDIAQGSKLTFVVRNC